MGLMVQNGLNEALTVALIKEKFDLSEVRIELEEVLESGHLKVFEVVAALLKNSD